jgi:hypothetical protein
MTEIDPNTPFTENLLRSLAATILAQSDETEAEYADRFAAATAWKAASNARRTPSLCRRSSPSPGRGAGPLSRR